MAEPCAEELDAMASMAASLSTAADAVIAALRDRLAACKRISRHHQEKKRDRKPPRRVDVSLWWASGHLTGAELLQLKDRK
jgi:hypothetical protein